MRFWLRVLVLLGVMFAGMEVLCRLVIGRSPVLQVDPRFGKVTAPDQPIVQSFEGFSRGRTNELGNLDEPMPSQLPEGSVMVLGDSYTEARHVSQDERYTNRLSTILARRVYNVGHAGWSPLNALAYLESEKARFEPSKVIVQISGNDLADIVANKRAHVVERAGELTIEWPAVEKTGSAKRITQLRELAFRSAFVSELVTSTAGLFGGKDNDDAAGGTSCTRPSGLAIRSLPWIFTRLRSTHPNVAILYLPRLDYHGGCSDQCELARQLYRTAAQIAHVRFVDATDAMCSRFRTTRQPLNGFWNTVPGTGHMNADGHAVVAELLAASLRR